ncbi:MAG: 2-hydroxyacid dehydrogenase [Victivallales bacterium]|nr:2-hydroxyacid dehydrogenase [Victivallales bacterium]
MMTKIAFFDTKPYDRQFFDAANRDFGFNIKYFEPRLSVDTATLTAGFDAVCLFVNDRADNAVIDTMVANKVRLLALRCAGYNNVNLYAACGRLPVVRVPAYSPHAVAEHAVALLLTLNRRIHRAYYRVRDNNFSINGLLGTDLYGKTVGVIGTGKIGKIFAGIMRGFGVKLLLYDTWPDHDFAAVNGATYTDLPTLYRTADVISLHCPLTPETHYMINADSLKQMKPGVFLINTSRGQLIHTAALIDVLKTGQIGGAALDVYEEENEYFFEDMSNTVVTDDLLARLNTFNNVLMTSHQAFFTREALTNIARTTLQNIAVFFRDGKLENGICSQCDGQGTCPGRPSGAPCPKTKSTDRAHA